MKVIETIEKKENVTSFEGIGEAYNTKNVDSRYNINMMTKLIVPVTQGLASTINHDDNGSFYFAKEINNGLYKIMVKAKEKITDKEATVNYNNQEIKIPNIVNKIQEQQYQNIFAITKTDNMSKDDWNKYFDQKKENNKKDDDYVADSDEESLDDSDIWLETDDEIEINMEDNEKCNENEIDINLDNNKISFVNNENKNNRNDNNAKQNDSFSNEANIIVNNINITTLKSATIKKPKIDLTKKTKNNENIYGIFNNNENTNKKRMYIELNDQTYTYESDIPEQKRRRLNNKELKKTNKRIKIKNKKEKIMEKNENSKYCDSESNKQEQKQQQQINVKIIEYENTRDKKEKPNVKINKHEKIRKCIKIQKSKSIKNKKNNNSFESNNNKKKKKMNKQNIKTNNNNQIERKYKNKETKKSVKIDKKANKPKKKHKWTYRTDYTINNEMKEKYQCKRCLQRFENRSSICAHIRSKHFDIKRDDNLETYLQNEKFKKWFLNYKEPTISQQELSKYYVKKIKKNKNNQKIDKDKKDKSFVCLKCKFSTAYKTTIENHVKKENNIGCAECCGKIFPRTTYLRVHYYNAHCKNKK